MCSNEFKTVFLKFVSLHDGVHCTRKFEIQNMLNSVQWLAVGAWRGEYKRRCNACFIITIVLARSPCRRLGGVLLDTGNGGDLKWEYAMRLSIGRDRDRGFWIICFRFENGGASNDLYYTAPEVELILNQLSRHQCGLAISIEYSSTAYGFHLRTFVLYSKGDFIFHLIDWLSYSSSFISLETWHQYLFLFSLIF